mmetsp:Transcript_24889/g.40980  ORF Transcript_24889/g.40980 Transcript_24889/m.40980 type:complete len:999 (+) Transcript_24889:144-3140(+)
MIGFTIVPSCVSARAPGPVVYSFSRTQCTSRNAPVSRNGASFTHSLQEVFQRGSFQGVRVRSQRLFQCHNGSMSITRRLPTIECGLLKSLKKAFANVETAATGVASTPDQLLRIYSPVLTDIDIYGEEYKKLSDEALRAKTLEFKERLQNGDNLKEDLKKLLPEAFAVVREASCRVLNLRHYDVQMIGGILLHEGVIAEMGTGEGKTLVASLPSYLNALGGKGVHVVTVNDYLAKRDAEVIGQIHRFLGLSVGLIQAGMDAAERKESYACDITYGTNSEIGFDYLRDNMALDPNELVQRPLNYCIVDEVDSILIDAARTPLILSEAQQEDATIYLEALETITKFDEGVHYEVKEKENNVEMAMEGAQLLFKLFGGEERSRAMMTPVVNALKAANLFQRDVDYLVREGEIVLIDQTTGRALPGRRFTGGLHQALEAKEGLAIKNSSKIIASITFQFFFRLYGKLSGMTGTAMTDKEEFEDIYRIQVVQVPPNKPGQREDFPNVVFKVPDGKYKALVDEVTRINEQGRPILIGTASVDVSQQIVELLQQEGLKVQVLNASPDLAEKEAEIIAQAGRKGMITVSTSMAGRGTDILLGGNAPYMAKAKLKQALIESLLEENHSAKSRLALPAEIFPADPSEESLQALKDAVSFTVKELGLGSLKMIEIDDRIAVASERVLTDDKIILSLRNAYNCLLDDFSVYTEAEKAEVMEAGGLHVIGTERQESRRIDNQLRGRAGRQGEPGSTRFLLSLDDEIFRIFGADRMKEFATKFNVSDDMPIQNAGLQVALDNVQIQTEGYFRGIRRTLFDFDRVLAGQRDLLYRERRKVLVGTDEEVRQAVISYLHQFVKELIKTQIPSGKPTTDWPIQSIVKKLHQFIPGFQDLKPQDLQVKSLDQLESILIEKVMEAYRRKEASVDRKRAGLMSKVEKLIILQQVNMLWANYLNENKAIQEKAGFGAMASNKTTPLELFKNQALIAFDKLNTNLRINTIYSIFQYNPIQP